MALALYFRMTVSKTLANTGVNIDDTVKQRKILEEAQSFSKSILYYDSTPITDYMVNKYLNYKGTLVYKKSVYDKGGFF